MWTLNEGTRCRPRRRSDGGIEAVAACKRGLAERMVGEHLNEATIARLGSILECGNMTGHRNCRSTQDPLHMGPEWVLVVWKCRNLWCERPPIWPGRPNGKIC